MPSLFIPIQPQGGRSPTRAILAVVLASAALAPSGGPAQAESSAGPASENLRLPATYRGTLPCADCQGIRVHLDLWSDGSYALRREWVGAREPLTEDALGRWRLDDAREVLVLQGLDHAPDQWEITGPSTLRALDRQGRRIEADLPYDLQGGPLDPSGLELTVQGLFTYFADSARLVECRSGQDLPVAPEAAYATLEAAYLAVRTSPQAPVLVELNARIEARPPMEGPPQRTVIADDVLTVLPEESCEPDPPPHALTDTGWRILSLQGQVPDASRDLAGPDLQFLGNNRFAAGLGCNRITGTVEVDGTQLRFANVATTRMACPDTLAQAEGRLIEALTATVTFVRDGRGLLLLGSDGQPLAQLDAVEASP
jgi:copper homeostasis protein (lipoprotein)